MIFLLPVLLLHADPQSCEMIVRPIPHRDLLLIPQERATTLPDWQLRPETIGHGKGGFLLDFREQQHKVTELALDEREEERQVIVIENKPIEVIDRCTGKKKTVLRPCESLKTVRVKVFNPICKQREVVVRTPTLKPADDVLLQGMRLDRLTTPAIERMYKALEVRSLIPAEVPITRVPVPSCPKCDPRPDWSRSRWQD